MRWRKRHSFLLVLGLIGGCGYIGFVQRAHTHVENAGWVVDFSYIRLACRTCRGRVEHLACFGRALPFPALDWYNSEFTVMTPVGLFRALWGTEYRAYSVEQLHGAEAGQPLAAHELKRGWYECGAEDRRWPPTHRPGTPTHWCLASNGYINRWLDPELIDDLDWPVPATAPTTQSQPSLDDAD